MSIYVDLRNDKNDTVQVKGAKRQMKLIIKRNKWLRGEGSHVSALLRSSDQKMCCLGFYCKAIGYTDEQITGSTVVHLLNEIKPETEWLINKTDLWRGKPVGSIAAHDLMQNNDDEETTEPQREADIIRIFAKNGVEVEFV